MAVSTAFAAGIISAGFSASTGLEIRNPFPESRRCSGCDLEESECASHTWRSGIKWVDDKLLWGWFFGGNSQRVRYWFPCPKRASREAAARASAPAAARAAPRADRATPDASDTVQLSIKDLFSMTSMTYIPPSTTAEDEDDQSMTMHVQMLKSNTLVTLDVNSNSTIADLRMAAADKFGLPRGRLMLILNGSQLDDHDEIRYLGMSSGCTIFCMKCSPGQRMGIFELDPSNLDPSYDFDFTNQSDDGKTYWRGGHFYQRPYGWKRYAVKVHGEYADDTWLGGGGIRTKSTPGEWAVSYHGTDRRNVRPILEEGYRIGRRERFGPAIYSSPNLEKIDEFGYTKTFTKDGKTYKLALQNRVDPGHLEVIPPEKTGYADFPYWLSPRQDPQRGVHHVRPYGVLTREVSTNT